MGERPRGAGPPRQPTFWTRRGVPQGDPGSDIACHVPGLSRGWVSENLIANPTSPAVALLPRFGCGPEAGHQPPVNTASRFSSSEATASAWSAVWWQAPGRAAAITRPMSYGSLNEWLALAPQAQAACGLVGALVSVNDFAGRPAKVLEHDEVLGTGTHRFRFRATPQVPHAWDAGLMFEETNGTLFCSDLFHQLGPVSSTWRGESHRRGGYRGPLQGGADRIRLRSLRELSALHHRRPSRFTTVSPP